MFRMNGSTIECATCPATGTSACSDCIVTFALANDAGPIEYLPTTIDREVGLFLAAGLVDSPVVFVRPQEFEREHHAPAASCGAADL